MVTRNRFSGHGAQGRAWLEAVREKVPSAKAAAGTFDLEKRWVSVAFTWNGLRALGVDEASLATHEQGGNPTAVKVDPIV